MRPITLILFLLVSITTFAQKQNNNWCFGYNAGVNFNTATPSAITSNLNMAEACATVSNRHTGALMFYASTNSVYNANATIMPNGGGVGIDVLGDAAQGVVIVPYVGDTNKYYVFNMNRVWGGGHVLTYSIVDMTLDNGLGDVVSNQKKITVDSNFIEAMTVTEGCGFYWLIVLKNGVQDYYAYKIDSNGISSNPVISPTTSYTQNSLGIGVMKVSPDRTKLGFAAYVDNNGNSFIAIHNYNHATGVVSGGMIIDDTLNSPGFYGCEFSPNSQMFYAVNFQSQALYQYDLSSGNAAIIRALRKKVVSGIGVLGQPQIGPDSNIYCSRSKANFIGRVSNPNAVIPLATFTANAIQLNSGTNSEIGLPQAVVFATPLYDSPNHRLDTLVCKTDTLVFYGRPSVQSYQWQNGSTADSFVATQPGTYWVEMLDGCYTYRDSFVVAHYTDTLSTKMDTTLCHDDLLVLRGKPGYGPYLWQDGSTADTFKVDTSGIYWVKMQSNCFDHIDTFEVTKYTDSAFSSVDSLICGDVRIAVRPVAPFNNNASYQWNTGPNVYSIFLSDEGTYWVTTQEKCKLTFDTVHVKQVPLIVNAGKDTVLCAGDTIVLRATTSPPTPYVVWSTGVQADTTLASIKGTYTFTAKFSGCEVFDKVKVNNYLNISFQLGADTEVCSSDRYVLPRLSSIDSFSTYLWQDGSNNRKFIVTESGRYTLTVSNECGMFSDTVDITVRNCFLFFPTAFSPNGDGRNDMAHLIGDIGNVQKYELRIYNRRGQEVYTTQDVNAGWDGYFNGMPCAMDTYYYFIKYIYQGEEQLDKGAITLIR